MLLSDVLKLPEVSDKTPQQVIEYLEEVVDLPHDHTRWSYDGVAGVFGAQIAEAISAALTAKGLTTAVLVYATKGMNLSLDEVQANLSEVAAAYPQLGDVCTYLKNQGRPKEVRWEFLGLVSLPSTEEVTNTKNEMAVSDWWSHVRDDIVPPMITSGKTIDEIKAAIAEVV